MFNTPISPVASPTAPLPTATQAGSAEPGAFARQLERAGAADANDTAPDTATPAPPQRAKLRTDAERNKADKPATRAAAANHSEDKTAAGAEPAHTADNAESAEASEAAVTADAAVLLASLLNRAVPAPVPGRGDSAADTGDAVAAAARGAGAADTSTAGAAETAHAAGTMPEAATDGSAALRERSETGPTLNPVASETPAFVLPQPGTHAAHDNAAPATAAAPAPYASQIDAPVGSPDFAPGLSAQVSVMVRDGLQEATLQLNPAEMGPITVQILIDGGTAQVTMTAEQAPTRDALEQAMPALAGALREEGLTLTGGGVFEQPRQAQDEAAATAARQTAGRSGGIDDDSAVQAAPAPRAAPRGMVDVFA